MKLVKVKSKQPNLKIRRAGSTSFQYEFESEDTVVEMPLRHANIVTRNPNFYIVGDEMEGDSKQEENKDEFIKELQKIKGIGSKTAKDVVAAYVTKNDLVKAIKEKYDMPFDDDIVESLKKAYGGKK